MLTTVAMMQIVARTISFRLTSLKLDGPVAKAAGPFFVAYTCCTNAIYEEALILLSLGRLLPHN